RRSCRARSPTPPCTNVASGATAARCPRLRSSRTTTGYPRARSWATTTLPMYPAPPVTRTLSFISALQAEEALQRLEQAVAPPGLRGLFEGDGRLVQELVEQRMAEVLDFSAVVRAQMREARSEERRVGKERRSQRRA